MKIKEFDTQSARYEEVESLDEAEALVTTYPNSSKAWLLYVVFYLKQADINKARLVAHRALQTINFREDKEKLNVWKALLNLENRHGSPESLQKVLREALQYQDQLKIYQHLINVYISTQKTEELEELSKTVLKKFKQEKDIWLTIATHYVKSGKLREARNLLTRSLQCLHPKEHPDVLGKFALLEHKHGEVERSFSTTNVTQGRCGYM